MFTSMQRQSIDASYFSVLENTPETIIIKSKNTGHTWKIQQAADGCYDIYHKHHDTDRYHWHRGVLYFLEVFDEIRDHDEFQLNGRRCTWAVCTREGWRNIGRKVVRA